MSKHCPSFIIWVHLRWTMWHVLVRIQNGGSSSENANHPTAKSGPFSIWVASQSGDLNRTFLWVRPCDDEVIDCLDKNNAGKAYRSGKSLLHSEHCQMRWHTTLAIILDILLFVVTVFQSNEPAINLMMFGSAYTRILET